MDRIQEIVKTAKKGMKRLNVLAYLGVFSGMLFGPGMIIISYIPSVMRELEGNPKMVRIFGVVFTLIFVGAMIEQAVKMMKDRRILKVLVNQPDDLVWIYTQVTTGSVRAPGTSIGVGVYYHVHFNLLDGTSAKVWLKQPDADRLFQLLMQEFPDLTYGYSEEIKKMYKDDPQYLKNNPQRVIDEKKSHVSSRI